MLTCHMDTTGNLRWLQSVSGALVGYPLNQMTVFDGNVTKSLCLYISAPA